MGNGHRQRFAATNEPGTCLWCGRPTSQRRTLNDEFDTATCAEQFGVTLARLGRRLQARGETRPCVKD